MFNSIMSYNRSYGFDGSGRVVKQSGNDWGNLDYGYVAGPMAFDIAAVQYYYGAKAANTGDTTYTLSDVDAQGAKWLSIWDTGGTDTIIYSGGLNAFIDLRAATLDNSSTGGGMLSHVANRHSGFTIANGVGIEIAIGGSGNDTLVGNNLDNVFLGRGGNDDITGGGGLDRANYSGNRGNYDIVRLANGDLQLGGPDGIDTLRGVERLQFGDQTIKWSSSFSWSGQNLLIGDFNGGGRSDVLLTGADDKFNMFRSRGDSLEVYNEYGAGGSAGDKVGDFNGDGRDDIIQVLPGNQNIYIWTSNGNSFNPVAVWGTGSLPTDKFADVNEAGPGGSADLVQFLDGSQKAYVATSNGANHFNAWSVWGTGFTSQDRLADFNGDGRADVIQILSGNQNAYVWLSTGNSFGSVSVWGSSFTPGDQFADITGDGKQDMIQILSNGNVYAWTANAAGTAFVYRGLVAQGALGAKIGDFNADGRADLIQLAADGNAYVWLANGAGGFNNYTNWGKGLPSASVLADGVAGDGFDANDGTTLADLEAIFGPSTTSSAASTPTSFAPEDSYAALATKGDLWVH